VTNQATSSASSKTAKGQFRLLDVLASMLVIGLMLAYLKQYEAQLVLTVGGGSIAAAIPIGLALGYFTGRSFDAAFWAVVIATAACFSTIGERIYGVGILFPFSWSAVGAVTGACCGAIPRQKLLLRIMIGGFVGWFIMWLFGFIPDMKTGDYQFDLYCAPVVGALVGLLIELVMWVESKRYAPRYVTACWLLSAVMLGNILVPYLVP